VSSVEGEHETDLIHIKNAVVEQIQHKARQCEEEEIWMLEKNVGDHPVTDEGGEIRRNVDTERGRSLHIFFEAESVEEHSDRRGKAGGQQQKINTLYVVGSCSVDESQVIKKETYVMLGPDVEDLREPGEIKVESVGLRAGLQRGQSIANPSLGE